MNPDPRRRLHLIDPGHGACAVCEGFEGSDDLLASKGDASEALVRLWLGLIWAVARISSAMNRHRASVSHPISAMTWPMPVRPQISPFACGLSAQWPGVIVTRIGRPNASAAAWGCVVSPPRDRPMAWASSPLLRGRVGMDLRDRRLDQHPFGSGTGAQCLEKPFPCLGAVHRRNQVRTACQCPGAGGGSRQGEAPRASQRIASVNGRSSAPLRPRAPALPGSSGPIRSHRPSVNVRLLKIACGFRS